MDSREQDNFLDDVDALLEMGFYLKVGAAPSVPLQQQGVSSSTLLKDVYLLLTSKDHTQIWSSLMSPPLSAEAEKHVDDILTRVGHISQFGRQGLQHTDIASLQAHRWLNDEVINFYTSMIESRSKTPPATKQMLDILCFSSFFWDKLIKDGYKEGRLSKWTKNVNIFSKDAVLLPVNHYNEHWAAASINFRKKRLEYYDSLFDKTTGKRVLRKLRDYICEESQDKGVSIDIDEWMDYIPEHTPQQLNSNDCGVFTCLFLDFLARGSTEFTFAQCDIPHIRRRLVWEVSNGKFWT